MINTTLMQLNICLDPNLEITYTDMKDIYSMKRFDNLEFWKLEEKSRTEWRDYNLRGLVEFNGKDVFECL